MVIFDKKKYKIGWNMQEMKQEGPNNRVRKYTFTQHIFNFFILNTNHFSINIGIQMNKLNTLKQCHTWTPSSALILYILTLYSNHYCQKSLVNYVTTLLCHMLLLGLYMLMGSSSWKCKQFDKVIYLQLHIIHGGTEQTAT